MFTFYVAGPYFQKQKKKPLNKPHKISDKPYKIT